MSRRVARFAIHEISVPLRGLILVGGRAFVLQAAS
jgi:hypothetical protein